MPAISLVTGSVIGNKTLKENGKAQEIVGKAENTFGDLRYDLTNGS